MQFSYAIFALIAAQIANCAEVEEIEKREPLTPKFKYSVKQGLKKTGKYGVIGAAVAGVGALGYGLGKEAHAVREAQMNYAVSKSVSAAVAHKTMATVYTTASA